MSKGERGGRGQRSTGGHYKDFGFDSECNGSHWKILSREAT